MIGYAEPELPDDFLLVPFAGAEGEEDDEVGAEVGADDLDGSLEVVAALSSFLGDAESDPVGAASFFPPFFASAAALESVR